MITSVTHFTLFVHDQNAALDFYTNKLGFIVHTDAQFGPDMRWLTICTPDIRTFEIALMLAENPEEQALVGKQAGEKPLLAFEVKDCHAAYESMKQNGVNFLDTPKEEPWGISMTCTDLYGNRLYLVEQK